MKKNLSSVLSFCINLHAEMALDCQYVTATCLDKVDINPANMKGITRSQGNQVLWADVSEEEVRIQRKQKGNGISGEMGMCPSSGRSTNTHHSKTILKLAKHIY